MKNIFTLQKLFICFVFFASILSVHAQDIVHIPDANFKAALLNNHTIDTNDDSEIQVSEAESYTGNINVSDKGISDLTGIEAFIALAELDCGSNNLSNLDVSNNVALEKLHCGYNKISNLDVSRNKALESLNCNN